MQCHQRIFQRHQAWRILIIALICLLCVLQAYAEDLMCHYFDIHEQDGQPAIIKTLGGKTHVSPKYNKTHCEMVIVNLAQMGYEVQTITKVQYQGEIALEVQAIRHGKFYQVIVSYPSLKILRIKRQA